LAAEIDQKYGSSTRLIEGSGGVFEVCVDGELIFSKKELGRFPENSEIYSAIDSKQS